MAFPKSDIKVNLENHFNSKIYTSSSPVTGNVTITTRREVRFESVQIILVGNTRTTIDGVSSPKLATHMFLKLVMPIPQSTYPIPRILEPGQTLTVPFNFVIPGQLTINACNHKNVTFGHLQDQHTLLPPTMGGWEKDDLSPNMARVEYSIKARVFRQDEATGKHIRVMEAMESIQVLPASFEEPPLNITKNDKLYTMSSSKSVRKNVLSKIGHLTANGTQPGAVVLRADGLGTLNSTSAQISLKFEPMSADVVPPKISCVTGKLYAHTYYHSVPITTFPNLSDDPSVHPFGDRPSWFKTSMTLPPISITHAPWKQTLAAAVRRDSGYSTDHPQSSPDGADTSSEKLPQQLSTNKSKRPASPVYHTTTLNIPIDLPAQKKRFIPTFHSCIASRVYSLRLSLTVGIGSSSSTVTLELPLQIAVESNDLHGTDLPSFEMAVQEAEAEAEAGDPMRPRILAIPGREFIETSVLPGYGDR
ncbi:arrestin [Podospora appendiculata]|uniref:Arrestin n=1 Tax=Podospora appendiculata TaxID=314037 RepID=A0AAE0X7H6_9PEZI|nr:arrestin [Podospora appendiculata]